MARNNAEDRSACSIRRTLIPTQAEVAIASYYEMVRTAYSFSISLY
jgi:hypothetical protein